MSRRCFMPLNLRSGTNVPKQQPPQEQQPNQQEQNKGTGLTDKVSSQLSKLSMGAGMKAKQNFDKEKKRKNIVFDF